MAQAQNVECLRLPSPTLATLLRGESRKANQPHWVQVKVQFEFGKTFPQLRQKSFRIASGITRVTMGYFDRHG
jgi:hypothetical protein